MGTDKKKEKFVLTQEALETFKQKTLFSVHILPACWGGYNKNDKLCQNCAVAIGGDNILVNIAEMAKKVNEDETFLAIRNYGGPFFAMYSKSCAQKRQELENAVDTLNAANNIRKERRAIENITRLPKGEVREGQAPFDYVKYYGHDGLWVRFGNFTDKLPQTMGILYRYDGRVSHRDQYYFRLDRAVGDIKSIMKLTETKQLVPFDPEKKEYFLVFPKIQTETQGTLALEVTRKSENGKEDEILYIALEADSVEKVSARFDDLGRL